MKKFWPHRSNAKGFSIQNFASKNRLNISRSFDNSNQSSNKILDDWNLMSIKEKVKKGVISDVSIRKIHWANRDFSEYKDAA